MCSNRRYPDTKLHEEIALAGYDWGGRAACIAAALRPDRCGGLASVNSYLIQDIAKAAIPVAPFVESGLWYQFYFLTERGRTGLTLSRREIAKTIWMRNSPIEISCGRTEFAAR